MHSHVRFCNIRLQPVVRPKFHLTVDRIRWVRHEAENWVRLQKCSTVPKRLDSMVLDVDTREKFRKSLKNYQTNNMTFTSNKWLSTTQLIRRSLQPLPAFFFSSSFTIPSTILPLSSDIHVIVITTFYKPFSFSYLPISSNRQTDVQLALVSLDLISLTIKILLPPCNLQKSASFPSCTCSSIA